MKKTGIIFSAVVLVLSIIMHLYINNKNGQSPYHFTFFMVLAAMQVLRLGLAYSVRNKKFD